MGDGTLAAWAGVVLIAAINLVSVGFFFGINQATLKSFRREYDQHLHLDAHRAHGCPLADHFIEQTTPAGGSD